MAGTSGCSRQLKRMKLSDTSCVTSGSDESGLYVKASPSEAHPASALMSFLSAGSESIMETAESVGCSAGTRCVGKEADHTTTSSGLVSAVEQQIERSKTHWSTLVDGPSGACMAEDEDGEGDCEAEVSNVREFMELQRHPIWGGFFQTFGYEFDNGIYASQGELVVGEKFAEGGQAKLFHAKVTWCYPEGNEEDEREGTQYVVKVFKKGTFLRDLKSQLPHGLLQKHVEDMENSKSPTPKVNPRHFCRVHRGILLKNGQFAFLMQKEDFDLRSLIERNMESRSDGDCGPFSKEDGELMMYSIALGVEWLHKRDIIHRDLKASNVLVTKSKSRWLNWFCVVADYECSIGVVGTGFFRAPEILQVCKERMVSQRPEVFSGAMDVYSYGMTCYEVLTGKLPFEDHPLSDNKSLLTDLVINQDLRPEIPVYVEGWARELLKWCWQCDPSARPTIGEILDMLSRSSAFIRRVENGFKRRFGEKRARKEDGVGHGNPIREDGCIGNYSQRRGVAPRRGTSTYVVEMRPQHWKWKLHFGSYNLQAEAMIARDYGAFLRASTAEENGADAGGFGTNDKLYEFEESPGIFEGLGGTMDRCQRIRPLYEELIKENWSGEGNPPHHQFCKDARKDICIAIGVFRERFQTWYGDNFRSIPMPLSESRS